MKILSLHIDGFGKFHDRDISFEDGLNVVYGKNEAGNPLYIHLSRACSLALSASGAALLKMIPIPNFSPGPERGL